MKKTFVATALLALSTASSWAQQPDSLTEKQAHGRQVFAQSCGVCHLQASMGAKTYGPALNKASGNGNDDIMRTFIMEGTPRMPAFKHYLKPVDVDAIIDYVRTVPAQTTSAAK